MFMKLAGLTAFKMSS